MGAGAVDVPGHRLGVPVVGPGRGRVRRIPGRLLVDRGSLVVLGAGLPGLDRLVEVRARRVRAGALAGHVVGAGPAVHPAPAPPVHRGADRDLGRVHPLRQHGLHRGVGVVVVRQIPRRGEEARHVPQHVHVPRAVEVVGHDQDLVHVLLHGVVVHPRDLVRASPDRGGEVVLPPGAELHPVEHLAQLAHEMRVRLAVRDDVAEGPVRAGATRVLPVDVDAVVELPRLEVLLHRVDERLAVRRVAERVERVGERPAADRGQDDEARICLLELHDLPEVPLVRGRLGVAALRRLAERGPRIVDRHLVVVSSRACTQQRRMAVADALQAVVLCRAADRDEPVEEVGEVPGGDVVHVEVALVPAPLDVVRGDHRAAPVRVLRVARARGEGERIGVRAVGVGDHEGLRGRLGAARPLAHRDLEVVLAALGDGEGRRSVLGAAAGAGEGGLEHDGVVEHVAGLVALDPRGLGPRDRDRDAVVLGEDGLVGTRVLPAHVVDDVDQREGGGRHRAEGGRAGGGGAGRAGRGIGGANGAGRGVACGDVPREILGERGREPAQGGVARPSVHDLHRPLAGGGVERIGVLVAKDQVVLAVAVEVAEAHERPVEAARDTAEGLVCGRGVQRGPVPRPRSFKTIVVHAKQHPVLAVPVQIGDGGQAVLGTVEQAESGVGEHRAPVHREVPPAPARPGVPREEVRLAVAGEIPDAGDVEGRIVVQIVHRPALGRDVVAPVHDVEPPAVRGRVPEQHVVLAVAVEVGDRGEAPVEVGRQVRVAGARRLDRAAVHPREVPRPGDRVAGEDVGLAVAVEVAEAHDQPVEVRLEGGGAVAGELVRPAHGVVVPGAGGRACRAVGAGEQDVGLAVAVEVAEAKVPCEGRDLRGGARGAGRGRDLADAHVRHGHAGHGGGQDPVGQGGGGRQRRGGGDCESGQGLEGLVRRHEARLRHPGFGVDCHG